MIFITIFLVIVMCLAVSVVRNKKKNYPPLAKGWLPVIGHALRLRGDTIQLWNFVKNISKECLEAGGALQIILGFQTYYFITDPDDALTIAQSINKHYSYDFAKRWLGSGLFTSSGETWKRHRKLLNPAFSLQVLLGFLDIFNKQSRKLLTKLDAVAGCGAFDISIHLKKMALENICLTALGISADEDAELLKSYAQAVEVLQNLIAYRFQNFWLHSDFLYSLTKYKRKENDVLKVINGVADVLIKRKRAETMQNKQSDAVSVKGMKSKALLDLLLELSSEETLTDQEIREEVDTAVSTALDSTVWVMTYTLILLGSHKEVQEKLFKELEEVFGNEDRDLNKHDLSKLTYMDAVLKESMRLYSIATSMLRTLENDVKLKNYTIKSGEHCVVLIYGLHRHPSWGSDREEFRPERWLEPETQNLVFAGFSLGRRSCIGKTYAMIMLKTTLSHLLRRYKVTANVNDLQFKVDVIMKPDSGHFVSIERRNAL